MKHTCGQASPLPNECCAEASDEIGTNAIGKRVWWYKVFLGAKPLSSHSSSQRRISINSRQMVSMKMSPEDARTVPSLAMAVWTAG